MNESRVEIESVEEQIRRYHRTQDRALRNQIVEDHRWLAVVSARQLARGSEPLDDLVQVAVIGVLKAVERFDPDYGVAFRTFASSTVRGELRRYYRDAGWSMRVPRRLKDLRYEIAAAVDVLHERLDRSPTIAEIADYLHLATDELQDCIAASSNYRTLPLDTTVDGEPTRSRDREAGWEDTVVDTMDDRHELVRMLTGLPERLRTIMVLRFVEEMNQSEIAAVIGISQVHVSRLLRTALTQLRAQAELRMVPS